MFALFAAYLALSVWGIVTMRQGLDYEKLLLKSDPLVRTIRVEIDLFHGGDQIEIAVVRAPSMTSRASRDAVAAIVREFETLPYSLGAKATQVWTREYEKYANQTGAFLRDDDHYSWVRGVYEWSRLFAFYKLW